MTIRIVTDSTCDIPREWIDKYNITVIPCYINMDGKSYLDGVEITRQEFYQRLPYANPHPTTSAPGPGTFLEAYEELAKEGCDGVFSIHVSKTFSNIYNSASMAADEVHSIPVKAVDSGNLTLALGLVVLHAAQAAANGANFEQVQAVTNAAIAHTHAFAKLDTIDYLRRSGRLSAIQHSLISMLDIKPILKMNAGVSKMEMVRTHKRAYRRVLEAAVEAAPQSVLFGITHADAPDQACGLIDDIRLAIPNLQQPLLSETTPALGTHVGPGTLCAVWTDEEFMQVMEQQGLSQWLRSKPS